MIRKWEFTRYLGGVATRVQLSIPLVNYRLESIMTAELF